ncbi:hypothetical protein RHGRI_035057 [Rhododendron griersonianum]|uniref:Uncharacterized protein n=1 Tax=Rhododendron griersonianum TaxID=479676 RepID=A0AAV6I3Y0_9ERIC|nr:hypothetical protein RHGRI_035057 [Rhododendron griersonianum]
MAMEIISRESIKPSSPTPDHLRTFRLSSLDKFIPNFLYFPHILYYSHDDSTTSINIKQAEISPLLIRSLSDALVLYYPFAGRVKCESSVDCDDQGVDFFEARVDTYLSDIIESSTSAEVLTKFVPTTSAENGGALLGIQLNYFNCGGIAIDLGSHGSGRYQYGRGSEFRRVHSLPAQRSTWAPDPDDFRKSPEHWGHTRRFCFSSSKIAALRAAVEASSVVQVVAPTHVEVVTAAIWKWFMARKGRDRCASSKASHVVNIRRRMDLPLSEFVFRNLAVVVDASGNGEMELGELVSKMREAIGKIDNDGIKAVERDFESIVEESVGLGAQDGLEWRAQIGLPLSPLLGLDLEDTDPEQLIKKREDTELQNWDLESDSTMNEFRDKLRNALWGQQSSQSNQKTRRPGVDTE